MRSLTQLKGFATYRSHHLVFGRLNTQKVFRYPFRTMDLHGSETVDDAVLKSAFEKLKLVELKEVVKKFGSKPKSLKKQELVSQILELYKLNSSTAVINVVSTNETEISKKKVRSFKSVNMTNAESNSSVYVNEAEPDYRSTNQNFPIGEHRNTRLNNTSTSSDMELIFLGTASCTPSTSRGVSAVALRYSLHAAKSQIWLFDCGESTQLQLQKSIISASKINKIFITHTHGDHLFGLGGTLCMLGQANLAERNKRGLTGERMEPVEIYGPEGIRRYLRTVIAMTYSRIAVPHVIHELKDVPYLHGRYAKRPTQPPEQPSLHNPFYGEIMQGRDIYPDANGVYNLLNDSDVMIQAAPLQHSIPCVGYVVHEKGKVGRLKENEAMNYIEQHKVTSDKSYLSIYLFILRSFI